MCCSSLMNTIFTFISSTLHPPTSHLLPFFNHFFHPPPTRARDLQVVFIRLINGRWQLLGETGDKSWQNWDRHLSIPPTPPRAELHSAKREEEEGVEKGTGSSSSSVRNWQTDKDTLYSCCKQCLGSDLVGSGGSVVAASELFGVLLLRLYYLDEGSNLTTAKIIPLTLLLSVTKRPYRVKSLKNSV